MCVPVPPRRPADGNLPSMCALRIAPVVLNAQYAAASRVVSRCRRGRSPYVASLHAAASRGLATCCTPGSADPCAGAAASRAATSAGSIVGVGHVPPVAGLFTKSSVRTRDDRDRKATSPAEFSGSAKYPRSISARSAHVWPDGHRRDAGGEILDRYFRLRLDGREYRFRISEARLGRATLRT